MPLFVAGCQIITSRSGWPYGSGFSITVLIRLKMAVLAPMPSASVATAASVKPGAFTSSLNRVA